MSRSRLRGALAATAVAVACALLCASALAAGWHVVKQKSAHGRVAALVAVATLTNPNGVAVNLKGSSGFVKWTCSFGLLSIHSWTSSPKAGFHVLGHTSGAKWCTVTASELGTGHILVQIETQ